MAKSKRLVWNVLRNYSLTSSNGTEKISIKVEAGQKLEQAEVYEYGKYIPKKYADMLVSREVLEPNTNNSTAEND